MTFQDQQLVALYEDNNLSLEEIAEDTGFELAAIKSVLMQYSTKFRAALRKGVEEDFTQEEFLTVKQTMLNLALSAENEGVRFRATEFIINEYKGRNEKKAGHGITNVNVSVNLINQQIKAARKALSDKKPIDV